MSIQLLKADGSPILCGSDGTPDTSQFIIDLNTAIEDKKLQGKVLMTILNGEKVYSG